QEPQWKSGFKYSIVSLISCCGNLWHFIFHGRLSYPVLKNQRVQIDRSSNRRLSQVSGSYPPTLAAVMLPCQSTGIRSTCPTSQPKHSGCRVRLRMACTLPGVCWRVENFLLPIHGRLNLLLPCVYLLPLQRTITKTATDKW